MILNKKIKNTKNYLKKFWGGNFSLPVSYWLFGFVYSFIIGLVIIFIGMIIGFSENMWGVVYYRGQYFGQLVVGDQLINTKV